MLAFGAPEQADTGKGGPRLVQVGRISVVAWPAELPLAIELGELADGPARWPGLGRRDPDPLRIIVVPDSRKLAELSGGRAPAWGAAVALPATRTILLRADAGDLPETLRHELAHLALREAVRVRLPRWFDEGYASYAAGEWNRLDALTINLAVARGAVPELSALDDALRGNAPAAAVSYALAMSAVIDLARRNPTGTLDPLIGLLEQGESFETAVRRTTGLNAARFAAEWRRGIRRRFGFVTWMAAGGAWALIAIVVLVAARYRRIADRPRRQALDEGWVVAEDEPGPDLDRTADDE